MPWNDKFECMPVEELQKFQLEKLKDTVAWVAEKQSLIQISEPTRQTATSRMPTTA